VKTLLKALFIAAGLLLCAGAVRGQTGFVGLYTDESATNCNLYDTGPDVHAVYVVVTTLTGYTALQFQLEPVRGAALTYLAETVPPAGGGTMGRADTGVGVALGRCVTEQQLWVLTVYYEGLGVSEVCSRLKIGPAPDPTIEPNGDKIVYVDCGGSFQWAEPGHLTINPNDRCACDSDRDETQAPVEITSWGQIKALYTN